MANHAVRDQTPLLSRSTVVLENLLHMRIRRLAALPRRPLLLLLRLDNDLLLDLTRRRQACLIKIDSHVLRVGWHLDLVPEVLEVVVYVVREVGVVWPDELWCVVLFVACYETPAFALELLDCFGCCRPAVSELFDAQSLL